MDLDAHRRLMQATSRLFLSGPVWRYSMEVPSAAYPWFAEWTTRGPQTSLAVAFRGHTNNQTVQLQYSTRQDNGEPTFIAKEEGRGEEAREGLQCTSISTPFLSPTSRTHMHAPACCSVSLHSTGALAPARISRSSSQEQKAPVRVSRGFFLSAFSTVSSISVLNSDSGHERNFVTVAG